MKGLRVSPKSKVRQRSAARHLLTALVVPLLLAVPASAEIEQITSSEAKCNNDPAVPVGGQITVGLHGPFMDWADNPSVSGNGVSISIIEKGDPKGVPKPYVQFRVRAAPNAALGTRTVTVSFGVPKETFNIRVIPRPRITRVTGETHDDFFRSTTFTIEGSDLPPTMRLTSAGLLPGSQLRGGAGGATLAGPATLTRQSASQAVVDFEFVDDMQFAHVRMRLDDGAAACFGSFNIARDAHSETTARERRNFVSSIDRSPPSMGNFNDNSQVTFRVTLQSPVPTRVRTSSTAGQGTRRRPKTPNITAPVRRSEIVFWRVSPPEYFNQPGKGSNGLSSLRIDPGEQDGTIEFFIKSCAPPDGGTTTLDADLVTFMHNTSAAGPPERVAVPISVTCDG